EANPPRVIDHVVVGDAPEGLAISPTGEIAVALLLRGSSGAGVTKSSWFYNKNSSAVVLKIDGKTVRKVGEVEVGAFAEGVVFSADGKYIYAGNFVDRDVSILRVDGTNVTNTGKRLQLPGRPAAMRGRTQ
ncbi:MAG: YncE family protein, partial [Candidatus Methylomirabilales bacterium]